MNSENNIIPDAASFYFAIRNMGYKNKDAIADIVDNSIDANASNIWITIDNLNQIFIADDGIGMDEDTLREAIRLGGKKNHDSKTELGKFGLGLNTASLSIGKSIRVITKQNGKYNTATLDYDGIQANNNFYAEFRESTDVEKISFDRRTNSANSGTVLIIDKCDQIQYTTVSKFVDDLNDHIKRIFRAFVNNGKNIYINDKPVAKYDPLFLNFPETKILEEKDLPINLPTGETSNLHVKAVAINDFGRADNKKLHLNIERQGFYVLRNNREIASALEFPEIYKKHNALNLLRIELSFNQDLDKLMGVNIKKQDIAPNQNIINELKNLLHDKIAAYRKEVEAKQKKDKEKPNPFVEPTPKPNTPDIQEPKPETPSVSKPKEVKFSAYAGEKDDSLFKLSTSDDAINVRYNLKNNYYSENIISSDYGEELKACLDKVIEASIKSYIEINGNDSLDSFIDSLLKQLN